MFVNIVRYNNQNILRIVLPNRSQTLSDTQHTKQTYPTTEKHKTYKDITLHSLQLMSKRQYNNSQGPDKLNIRYLKHLGPLGLAFLTSILKTVLNNIICHIWKLVNIVPIPKPNKDKSISYRPIPTLSVITDTNTPTQHGNTTQ